MFRGFTAEDHGGGHLGEGASDIEPMKECVSDEWMMPMANELP